MSACIGLLDISP